MFYDFEIYKLIKVTTENEIGELVETYKKDTLFMGDIQPTNGFILKAMGWGDDVKGNITLFTDETLNIGDKVEYKGYYEIEKAIPWDDYKVYSLKRVDLLG